MLLASAKRHHKQHSRRLHIVAMVKVCSQSINPCGAHTNSGRCMTVYGVIGQRRFVQSRPSDHIIAV